MKSASFLFMTLFWSESPFSRYWACFADVQQLIFQKTVNISKTAIRIKKVTNKEDAKLNSASFLFTTHFWSESQFSRYWAYFPKNAQYLENGESDQKSFTNEKRRGIEFRVFFIHDTFFFIRVTVFEILSVFSKKRSISQKRRIR